MLINKKTAASVIVTGTLLLSAFAQTALADTTIQISGNGSNSTNNANTTLSNNTTVVQNNNANVTNNVTSNANSGGNHANDNTGGDTTIDTGAATSTTNVSTRVNTNHADVNNCGCNQNTDVLISGNGHNSTNNAKVNQNDNVNLFQTNDAYVNNTVDAKATTGRNDANRNTGGDTLIRTGNAQTNVKVGTAANANVATVGGGSNGTGTGGTLSARIIGNGSNSTNTLNLTDSHEVLLTQQNNAYIDNNVIANAKSGHNRANDNTGGDTTIDTGMARTKVIVDNLANFNAAAVGCDCLMDTLVKVSNNGFESDNHINADLSKDLSVFQGGEGSLTLDNRVDGNSRSGDNDSNRNTGDSRISGDGVLNFTGDSVSTTTVSNAGNSNVFTQGADLTLPGGLGLSLDLNLGDLWKMFI